MLVYRIEDEDGKGMYHSSKAISMEVDERKHKEPCSDSLLAPVWLSLSTGSRETFVFGFASIEQLRNWVYDDDWLYKLHETGFILSVYDVPDKDVIAGHTQVMFLRFEDVRAARIEHSIKEYFKLEET